MEAPAPRDLSLFPGAQMLLPDGLQQRLFPGAQMLQPDEAPYAGCSALVVLEESEGPVPARIMQVWDNAFVHVDYSVYGIPRLDEIVEMSRLLRVVKVGPVAQGPADSASHSVNQVNEGGSLPPNAAGIAPRSAPDDPLQQEMPSETAEMAFVEDFKKLRTGQALDQKQQELQRLQAALQQQKQAMQQAVRLTFAVDDDLLGLVVGAKGGNLARARRLAGIMSVEIEGHQVCVVAATQEDAEAARDVLEYMRQRVPIAPHNRQLLIGRAGKNIRDIQAKCGLHWMNVSEHDVELVGSRKSIDMAKRAIDLVIRFMSEQKALQQDTEKLVREVRTIPFGLLDRPEGADDDSTWRDNATRVGDAPGGAGGAGGAQERPSFEMQVPVDKVRFLIGKDGATIRELSEKCRCLLWVDKEAGQEGGMASVLIQPLPPGARMPSAAKGGVGKDDEALEAGDVQAAVELITECIDDRARTIKQGVYPGAVLYVRVGRVVDFGAFVALPHGKEGLLHISELSNEHVESVQQMVDVGDELYVVVLSVDERGRPRLSIKDVDQEHGTFYGRLELENAAGGNQTAKESRTGVPVRLDDQSLWPTLDAVHAPGAAESSARNTGAVKTEEEARQEWKDRIRQQREKAAQEAANVMQGSVSSSRAGKVPQQAPRQQQKQALGQDFRSSRLQRGAPGEQKARVQPVHMFDQDYRRDMPVRTTARGGMTKGLPRESGAPAAPVVSVGGRLDSRPSDRDGGEGEGGAGMSLRARLASKR